VKVEVRLFAGLRDALPDAPRGRGTLPRMAQMVLVNGVQTPRDRASRQAHRLADGDVVAIFPPVAGG
jgi:molybdopterin converting factor small subunit